MKNVIVTVLIVAVLGVLAFFIFSGKKPTITNPLGSTTSTIAPVPVVEKDSILESIDGGLNFISGLNIQTTNSLGPVDILAIAFHPTIPGTLILGSLEDGLFKKDASSLNWIPIPFPPKNIYSFLLDKKNPDKRIFASGVTGGYGNVFRTDDAGANWRAVYTEPGTGTTITSLAQDPRNTNIIFAGTSGGTVIKSMDGGNSWKNVGSTINGTVKDISFDATKPSVMYLLASGSKMFYSLNEGETWLDWDITKNQELQALQQQQGGAYKAGGNALVKKIQDEITALQQQNNTQRINGSIIVITPDPRQTGVVYAGTNQGLFRSSSYGKYWQEINIIESAKKYPIRSIAINPKNSNEIVFVSGKSFYKSTNDGATWSITALSSTSRDASFVAYNPFNTKDIFIGLSANLSN